MNLLATPDAPKPAPSKARALADFQPAELFLNRDLSLLEFNKRVLELAYGIRGVVRKRRYLYLVGHTRVHVDDVEGLGHFMELEVVLQPGQSDADGQAIAERLMSDLGVEKEDLLEGAYMDLLESSTDSW